MSLLSLYYYFYPNYFSYLPVLEIFCKIDNIRIKLEKNNNHDKHNTLFLRKIMFWYKISFITNFLLKYNSC